MKKDRLFTEFWEFLPGFTRLGYNECHPIKGVFFVYIDFHTHAFPDRIAGGALDTLSRTGGGLKPCRDGTLASLSAVTRRTPGARALILPIATKPAQQTSINNWAAAVDGPQLMSFGSIHPDAPDALEELERIRALGLKGVKLHPEYQNFFVDDPKMKPLYRRMAELGLICLFHAGMDAGFMPPSHCSPERLRRALNWFEGSAVVAAHFGGYMMWDEVLEKLCGLPLYLDTSYSHSRMIKPLAQAILKRHGADRVLFGSDSPWSPVEDELLFVRSLELAPEVERAVLCENARRLLGL